MKFKVSLKRLSLFIIVFSALVPVLVVMLWYGQAVYNHELNDALLKEQYINEISKVKIESEVKRFQTLLTNKSDPLSIHLDESGDPETLMQIKLKINGLISQL